jgi:hypothetical protein
MHLVLKMHGLAYRGRELMPLTGLTEPVVAVQMVPEDATAKRTSARGHPGRAPRARGRLAPGAAGALRPG